MVIQYERKKDGLKAPYRHTKGIEKDYKLRALIDNFALNRITSNSFLNDLIIINHQKQKYSNCY